MEQPPKPTTKDDDLKYQIYDIQINEFHLKPVRMTRRQKNVYDLLKSGKRTVTEITNTLGYSDPRAYIRILRDRGIPVQDRWIHKKDTKHKIYWID